jgi:RNA polymerase sigma-70 factor (sigma-E family)
MIELLRGRRAAAAEFDAFVEAHTGELVRTAYLVVWDLAEAEDLVQETLLRIAKRWPRVRGMEHPGAYARKILVNLALDESERRVRRLQELDGQEPADRADRSSARALWQVDARSALIDALAKLPPRQRAVLVLRYFLDLPEAEVAAALGCSVGTVKSTASRGLARLEQDLPTRSALG